MPIQFKRDELINLRTGAVPFDCQFNYQRGLIRNKVVFAFGDVIRSAASPGTHPFGIGGDANTIWHSDTNANWI